MGFIHRARLMPDGRLIILVGETADTPGHVRQYDWNGSLLWDYTPEDGDPHHDFWPTDDGGVMLICKAPVPAHVSGKIADPARRELTIYDDTIVEVSHDKQVVWRWRQHEHLDINVCNPHPADRDWEGGPDNNTTTDWTHTNTVQVLPENRWFDAGDERFRPGNVMITMRQLDTILVIDRKTGQAVWSYTGDFHGGLSGPHEGGMIPKPLPGAGNILVFDNGALPYRDLAHAGKSYVLEIDPPAKKVVWIYKDGQQFFSPFTSNCQRLANGNTLILEASCRRAVRGHARRRDRLGAHPSRERPTHLPLSVRLLPPGGRAGSAVDQPAEAQVRGESRFCACRENAPILPQYWTGRIRIWWYNSFLTRVVTRLCINC